MRTAPDTATPRRSRWVWIAVGIVALAVIGVIAYIAVYNGGGGYSGGGGTGSGAGGGGYFVLAFSGEEIRRLRPGPGRQVTEPPRLYSPALPRRERALRPHRLEA